jgi:predicted kinase
MRSIRLARVGNQGSGPIAYMVAYAAAEDNLRGGSVVVTDSVNPLKVTRYAWRSVAKRTSSPVVEVETIRSDRDDHQRIVTTRTSDIEGLSAPTWDNLVTREYEAWEQSHLVIDTSFKTVDESMRELLAALKLETVRNRSAYLAQSHFWNRTALLFLHSITSSARAKSASGMLMASVLAVPRLMAISSLVARETGISAGLAPLRIWPT